MAVSPDRSSDPCRIIFMGSEKKKDPGACAIIFRDRGSAVKGPRPGGRNPDRCNSRRPAYAGQLFVSGADRHGGRDHGRMYRHDAWRPGELGDDLNGFWIYFYIFLRRTDVSEAFKKDLPALCSLLLCGIYRSGIFMSENRCLKKLWEKNCKRASYTVEAALVLPFILLIMAAFLYVVFYLHDQYILYVYANRMARECCWEYVENEHAREQRTSREIIGAVEGKYGPELEDQLLMSRLTASVGTCKKNLLTKLYTATWRVVGEPETLIDLSVFHVFEPVVYEASYERLHIRQWFYKNFWEPDRQAQ